MLLPFVPVTARTGARTARAKSSTSPTTSMPRASASRRNGLGERHAWRHDDLRSVLEELRIEPTEPDVQVCRELAEVLQLGGSARLSVIATPCTVRTEIPRAREPSAAETDDHRATGARLSSG